MPHQYSTALSHLVLAGTGIYCIISTHRHHNISFSHIHLSCATFGIIVTNSLLGVWRWGNPDHGDKVEKPYEFTSFLQTIFAFPCIVGEIWLMSSFERILAYLHPLASVIPLAAYVADKSHSDDVIDLIIFINIVSCAVISYQIDNHYGIATALAFAVNHFYIRKQEKIFDVPSRDFYNYALCFFTYFAYKSVGYQTAL